MKASVGSLRRVSSKRRLRESVSTRIGTLREDADPKMSPRRDESTPSGESRYPDDGGVGGRPLAPLPKSS